MELKSTPGQTTPSTNLQGTSQSTGTPAVDSTQGPSKVATQSTPPAQDSTALAAAAAQIAQPASSVADAGAGRAVKTHPSSVHAQLSGGVNMVGETAPGLPVGDSPKNNVPGNKRKQLSPAEMQALKDLPEMLKGIAPKDPNVTWEDYLVTNNVVDVFRAQYAKTTGVEPIYAPDLISMLRDHGQAVIDLHARPVKIGVTTFSGKPFDQLAAKQMMSSIFAQLEKQGVDLKDVALVTGFTNLGGVKSSYDAAKKFDDIERVGITAGKGLFYEMAHVDKGLVIGTQWGEDSPLFLDTISDGFLITFGGGAQAEKETRWFLQRHSDRSIIAEGFFEHGKDGTQKPGAADKIEKEAGGIRFGGAVLDPVKVGADIGQAIAKAVKSERRERLESPLLKLAIEASPKQIVEVEQWAKATTGKYRILRVLNAVRKKLEVGGVQPARINELLTELSFSLVQNTFGIDNFKENALWQKRAKEAMQAVGQELTQIIDPLATDVMWASWFGIQEMKKAPSYFEKTVGGMPKAVLDLPTDGEHTFHRQDYGEVRLDFKTAAFLKVNDATPEVFVGTREELELFYRAKGFEMSSHLADSNGTTYMLMQNGASRQVVIHGVDSEARLIQVGALMKTAGVDVSKVAVRGETSRLRQMNANMLELSLASLERPVAAVVVGNKNESVAALAQMAGVEIQAIKTRSQQNVGPFRYEVLEVQVAGKTDPQLVVAFAPAYGELSADLVEACHKVGAQNVMIAGAGGSLVESDKLGVVHALTGVLYDGGRIDLDKIPNVKLLDVPGATQKAINVFSPTPLEQTVEWAKDVRAKGAHTVDQETGPIFSAIAKAAQKSPMVVMAGLHQSDVVGKNFLAQGTVDDKYAPNVLAMAKSFYGQLGISGVKTTANTFAPVENAKPGLLAKQSTASVDYSRINVPLPDPNTINASQSLSTETQYKGQKRVLYFDAQQIGSDDRSFARNLLRSLNPSQYWVVVRAGDAGHGEILDMAQRSGFETIALATQAEIEAGQVQSKPTFVLGKKDAQEVEACTQELVRDASQDPYEPNPAKHWRIVLGKAAPEKSDGVIYSALLDPDDADEVADQMKKELKAVKKRLKSELETHFSGVGKEPPKLVDLEEIGEVLAGRQPVLFSGASKKSWPELTAANQDKVTALVEETLRGMDPKQHVVVTGGTDFGVEKIVHAVAAKLGFDIVGTITETTKGNEVALGIGHVVLAGINWFGKSRPTLREIVEAHNGVGVIVGGGQILLEEGMLALKLNLKTHLMDLGTEAEKPQGASSKLAQQFPAHSFRNSAELLGRMGIKAKAQSAA